MKRKANKKKVGLNKGGITRVEIRKKSCLVAESATKLKMSPKNGLQTIGVASGNYASNTATPPPSITHIVAVGKKPLISKL